MSRNLALGLACAGIVSISSASRAAVVINEVLWDDTGTDDREFVELYNNGATSVDISGWTVGTRDSAGVGTGASAPVAITGALGSGTTVLAPGAYYVIANPGTLNVNQTAASGFLENDTETVELRDGAFATGILQDALVYEGSAPFALPADVAAQSGQSYWANHTGADIAGTPLNSRHTIGRYVSGRDTNNNGRDFGVRPGTPGTANSTTFMTAYVAPNVDAQAEGSAVAGLFGSFVGARAFTPGVVTPGLNLNAIPNAPGTEKAIIAWDGAGGGNAVYSEAVFDGTAGAEFGLWAYLDTNDLPVSTNNTNVAFRGSEQTFFGLAGSTDVSSSLVDVSGLVGVGAANTVNGASGVAWYYEKVGVAPGGGTTVSEKLYLIDAGDSGNMNTGGANATPDEWVILATIDLSSSASDWHWLTIDVDASGVGTASFDGQVFNFVTGTALAGEFYVGYRENTQAGLGGGTPSYLRPATFAIPEPSSLALLGLGGLALARRRRA
jgi:hypothetical protein